MLPQNFYTYLFGNEHVRDTHVTARTWRSAGSPWEPILCHYMDSKDLTFRALGLAVHVSPAGPSHQPTFLNNRENGNVFL